MAHPIAPGELVQSGAVEIRAASATHRGHRYTVDRWRGDANMYLFDTNELSCFFAGDIIAKFSYLDAVVDDRTYFLIPDPVGSGDGGVTKVYQATAGQTWTLNNSTVWDMTFGFSRQKQDVLGPDANLGNYGIDTLHIPGTNDQGKGDERYGGIPEFRSGFTALGNYEGWMPIFRDERTYSLADQRLEDHGPSRHPRRLHRQLSLPDPLAAGDRQPARPVRLHHAQRHRAQRRPGQ